MITDSITLAENRERVLVVGASGLLGSRLAEKLDSKYQVFKTYMNNSLSNEPNHCYLDLLDTANLHRLISKLRPSTVINCSGFTLVDQCEKQPELCWLVNSVSAAKLAFILSHYGTRLIHISTDHFASHLKSPRTELDEVWALNQYGYSKLVAEKEVLSYNSKNLVLRTNFFGSGRFKKTNFWDITTGAIKSKNAVVGFNDVLFSPVSIDFLVQVIELSLERKDIVGLRNIASSEVLSKFDFLVKISEQLGRNPKLIIPINSGEVENRAIRPKYLALDGTKIYRELMIEAASIEQMIRDELSYCGLGES